MTPQENEEQGLMLTGEDLTQEPVGEIVDPEEKVEGSRLIGITTEVNVQLGNSDYEALVDTGSVVSLISEQVFQHLGKESEQVPMLPVVNVTVQGFTGKITKVRKQILMNVKIGAVQDDIILLVVKGLVTPVILGTDWLRKRQAVIDLSRSILELRIDKMRYEIALSGPTRVPAPVESISTDDDSGMEWEQNVGRFYKNVERVRVNTDDVVDNSICEVQCGEKQMKDPLTEVSKIVESYATVFSDKPGIIKVFECKLKITDTNPFLRRSYPIPHSKRAAVDREIARMLEWGIIEKSTSPFSNPVVVVNKKDGTVRICLDARWLNKIIEPDRESPPIIEDLLQKFHGMKFFTSLDMTSGYWQLPLHPESRKYTAFLVNGKSYQFRVLPFGLNVSVAMFGKCMDLILGPEVLEFATVFVDDVLVASKTLDEHLVQLEKVFQCLDKGGMKAKLSKCEFLKDQVVFLGYVLSAEGVKPDPTKIETIVRFPAPRNKRELQSFLGVCTFYRRFIQNHSECVSKLTHLLRNGRKWLWGKEEEEVFAQIKTNFVQSTVLAHPDFYTPFYVSTDASKRALGAHLFQLDESGEIRNIAFASRTLLKAEANYTTTELELLAVVFACKKFRSYILGYQTVVYTDHKALSFLFECKFLSERLSRYILYLQEYRLTIHHCSGSDNVIADCLSRYGTGSSRRKDAVTIAVVKRAPTLMKELQAIGEEQERDQNLRWIKMELERNVNGKQEELRQNYVIHEGVLFRKGKRSENWWLVCIPEQLITPLVQEYHLEYGHFGSTKILKALAESCYFHKMERRVRKIVGTCEICQKAKVVNHHTEGYMTSIICTEPLQMVSVDLFGPLPTGRGGVTYIFVVMEMFSKFVKLYPIKRATAKVLTARMVQNYIQEVGKPEAALSDQGTQFKSKEWCTTLEREKIRVRYSAPYHPQSNPVERVMRELGRMFRTYCYRKHTSWPNYVNLIENWLNCTQHDSTGFTAYELLKGEKPLRLIEKLVKFPERKDMLLETKIMLAHDRTMTKAQRRKARHDLKLSPRQYQPGDLVLLKTHCQSSAFDREIKKFFLLYEGPFEVITEVGKNAYALRHPVSQVVRGTFNVIHLKPYKSD